MGSLMLWVLAFQAATGEPQAELPAALEKVAEEAEIFFRSAHLVVGQETLEHKGRRIPGRFKQRFGAPDAQTPKISYNERVVTSEYGFAAMKNAPGDIREFRQVVKVNGREVAKADKARHALVANMKSEDDRARKRMLEEFEKHGLIGAATDFGQAILMFRKSGLANFDFEYDSSRLVGLDAAMVIRYKQKQGEGMRLYDDKNLSRPKLAGELWVRRRDYMPLRVTFAIEAKEYDKPVLHEAEVRYERSKAHGVLLPTQVRYARKMDGETMIENVAKYTAYRMFKVEADIKFTPAEEIP